MDFERPWLFPPYKGHRVRGQRLAALDEARLSHRMRVRKALQQMSLRAAEYLGAPWSMLVAGVVIGLWLLAGPALKFSDRWQLAIGTLTSVVTFLMVFVIQYSQNRDVKALQLKLDELIRAVDGARTHLVQLEQLSDEDLAQLSDEFQEVQSVANTSRGMPDVEPGERSNREEVVGGAA